MRIEGRTDGIRIQPVTRKRLMSPIDFVKTASEMYESFRTGDVVKMYAYSVPFVYVSPECEDCLIPSPWEIRNGYGKEKRGVFLSSNSIMDNFRAYNLNDYGSDLKHKDGSSLDIVRVIRLGNSILGEYDFHKDEGIRSYITHIMHSNFKYDIMRNPSTIEGRVIFEREKPF